MQWLSLNSLQPTLPDHCTPQNDFLLRFSSAFHTCVPTPLAFTSNLLGALSIVAWLFAQLPQIYKNWTLQSTSGLSIFFLVEWCLGDLGNLLGALFTHQASWQVAIGSYYVFVDLCLVGQWLWFEKLKHGHPVFRVWRRGGQQGDGDDDGSSGTMEQVVIEGMDVLSQSDSREEDEVDNVEGEDTRKSATRPKIIFRAPTFQKQRDEKNEKGSGSLAGTPSGGNTIHRLGTSSSPMPSPSPRTMLFIACLVAMAHASPISHTPGRSLEPFARGPTKLEQAGTILSWMSTFLYLGSRLPQLIKNYRRKSTAGLSPHLFIAAFCGNLFYSSAILTNPCAWDSFAAYGGGGWVGPEGSDRATWILAALPFFLGAFGVLGLDASVGVQFLVYGEGSEKLVVVEREEEGRKWHWRRVSGWMRGWVPSISEGKGGEREELLGDGERRADGYGGL
ncbi:hypothetical protein M409DRAFT_28324 [Zasmidium cellare ATCC 36951]|uniref:PQ loop repeat protein n=1 Tax=Zasmidium cellare ATCC 36951 TaxID=1080233 RepID=A0A6A6C7D1_ZASCE|nr:uncharacterized protein M409DRAFT_28324 [Zasmidium cellare ATCC 36951]KAF2161286.1 hypothetical protein M409DRAFT_28324 [Zasmidium cellare ATCC 36951]